MAFSAVTERGSASNKVSGTTLAGSPSANLTVGKIVYVLAVTDNISLADGPSTDHTSITDTDLNTWTKVYERTTANAGVANSGATASLWWTKVTTQIDTSDSITLTIGAAVVSKVIGFWEVTVAGGQTVQLAGTIQQSEGIGTDPGAATLSGLPSKEYLFLGIVGREEEVITWAEDADYTNVFAAEGVSNGTAGAANTNVIGNVGYRILTGTGDTFDVSTLGGTALQDWTQAFLAFEEVTPGGVTEDPYPYIGGGYYPHQG